MDTSLEHGVVAHNFLLSSKKYLTWDCLLIKGFVGPSFFHMCCTHEEMDKNLFNSFQVVDNLWHKGAIIFRQSNRNRGCLKKP
jgi:hypothetical protein